MIRVAIADDQVLLREMLSMILSQDNEIEVVAEAGNGEEIVKLCREKNPDIVLLDIKMPEYDGVYALNLIKRDFPEIKCIMLTTFDDKGKVLRAYKGGANGYILKDVRPETLLMSVKCIYGGLFVAHESANAIIRRQIGEVPGGKGTAPEDLDDLYDEYGLDRIDRKIIKLLINGKSNKEIGETLNFSEGTIKNRISRIISITGQKDRTQIAVFALQNNLV